MSRSRDYAKPRHRLSLCHFIMSLHYVLITCHNAAIVDSRFHSNLILSWRAVWKAEAEVWENYRRRTLSVKKQVKAFRVLSGDVESFGLIAIRRWAAAGICQNPLERTATDNTIVWPSACIDQKRAVWSREDCLYVSVCCPCLFPIKV